MKLKALLFGIFSHIMDFFLCTVLILSLSLQRMSTSQTLMFTSLCAISSISTSILQSNKKWDKVQGHTGRVKLRKEQNGDPGTAHHPLALLVPCFSCTEFETVAEFLPGTHHQNGQEDICLKYHSKEERSLGGKQPYHGSSSKNTARFNYFSTLKPRQSTHFKNCNYVTKLKEIIYRGENTLKVHGRELFFCNKHHIFK